ncbi:MAG: hypothetical protein KJP25_05255 [Gammaproteobacteria bacterium]|nr:hypothetical protein [Gammaproteobacteria bacterium]NNM11985.1 hypothetical protein [Pseudomonadales bacterium]
MLPEDIRCIDTAAASKTGEDHPASLQNAARKLRGGELYRSGSASLLQY